MPIRLIITKTTIIIIIHEGNFAFNGFTALVGQGQLIVEVPQ